MYNSHWYYHWHEYHSQHPLLFSFPNHKLCGSGHCLRRWPSYCVVSAFERIHFCVWMAKIHRKYHTRNALNWPDWRRGELEDVAGGGCELGEAEVPHPVHAEPHHHQAHRHQQPHQHACSTEYDITLTAIIVEAIFFENQNEGWNNL